MKNFTWIDEHKDAIKKIIKDFHIDESEINAWCKLLDQMPFYQLVPFGVMNNYPSVESIYNFIRSWNMCIFFGRYKRERNLYSKTFEKLYSLKTIRANNKVIYRLSTKPHIFDNCYYSFSTDINSLLKNGFLKDYPKPIYLIISKPNHAISISKIERYVFNVGYQHNYQDEKEIVSKLDKSSVIEIKRFDNYDDLLKYTRRYLRG